MPEEIITGPVHNHTRFLSIGEIRQAVEGWVRTHGGPAKFPEVHPVHAAPADDNTTLTKAVRAWREAGGQQQEFTQEIKGRMVWIGFRYGAGR